MSDNVEHPSHYNAGGVETIEGIKSALGDGFLDYCRGNVLKYVWRCRHKGRLLEDLRKAAKYLEWAIEEAESEKPSEPQPLEIPEGWRELEPRETPLANDMYEHEEMWMKRSDDANCEYEWYDVRHIRKIEPSNPSEPQQPAIPEGWRELEENEPLSEGDLFDFDGEWVGHEYDPSGGVYSSRIHRRHIRKIETEKPSEFPNSSIPEPGEGYRLLSKDPPERLLDTDEGFFENGRDGGQWLSVNYSGGDQLPLVYYRRKIEPAEWIPKVGDKVRVNSPGRIVDGLDCVVTEAENGKYTAEHYNLTSVGLKAEHLELIEAAQ